PSEHGLFRKTLRAGLAVTALAGILVAFSGHHQAQLMAQDEPMKLASAEALWEDEDGAGFSIFAVGDVVDGRNHINIQIPHLLSILATNSLDGNVQGINDVQERYEAQFGPGSYV
ncbi:cytochrome ubiquinol oxidase subunit I, partial [Algoriphagus aestuarii]|nr:cytochrome ubiquinol oxidase subunit I [Algoriphagus aestuarii]